MAHLMSVHKGIPHTEGEELSLCRLHPEAGSMNHLEFVKHAQEESSKASGRNFGFVLETSLVKSPQCSEVKVQAKQIPVVQKQLVEAGPLDLRPIEIRRRFGLSTSGALVMVLMGYQLARLSFPPNLTGATDLVAGFVGLAGWILFYAQPTQLRLGASISIAGSTIGWIPLIIFVLRVFAGESLVGPYLLFLLLGPLLSLIGAVLVLSWKRKPARSSGTTRR